MCYGIKPILRVDEQESLLVMLARCNIKQAYLATNQRRGDRLACSAQVSIKRSIAQHKDLKRAAPPQGSNCPYPPYPPYPTYLSIYQSTNLSIYLSIYLPTVSIYIHYHLLSIYSIHLLSIHPLAVKSISSKHNLAKQLLAPRSRKRNVLNWGCLWPATALEATAWTEATSGAQKGKPYHWCSSALAKLHSIDCGGPKDRFHMIPWLA